MTINISGRNTLRIAAAIAATIGVGAAAFFGGTNTRMSDDAVASQKTVAVKTAVEKTENENAVEKAIEIDGVKDAAALHEKRAVKRAVRKERKRAERLAETARNEGYSDGSVAGYGSGHSAGYSEGESEGFDEGMDTGYAEGESEGFEEGMDTASDDLDCSDDPDVALPYCSL